LKFLPKIIRDTKFPNKIGWRWKQKVGETNFPPLDYSNGLIAPRTAPNIISIKKEEKGAANAQPALGGDTVAAPDLLLEHLDATIATYVRRQIKHLKHIFKTLAKTLEKQYKTYATI
jgi:hypothetical protein